MTAPTSIRTQDKTGSSETMLHIRLSTALLLATSCVLWTAVSMKMVTICEGSGVQRLSCDSGSIGVHTALYGRADETCSEGKPLQQFANTECPHEGSIVAIDTRCNHKKECEISTDYVRNSDPCNAMHKHLQIQYNCFPERVHACEGSSVHVNCDEGRLISVHLGIYGRLEKAICSSNRPEPQISNICYNMTSNDIVSERCNGKNSCTVEATNSVFGDPCVGTYKYLEINYFCVHPQ